MTENADGKKPTAGVVPKANRPARTKAAQAVAPVPPSDTRALTLDVENQRFNALRNALYHTARRRWYERWNRLFNFLVVVLGAAAMGDVMARFGVDQLWVGAAIAVVGAAQLVFDFGRAARDHQVLQRDYYNLVADIAECVDPDDARCASWAGKLSRIAADEPPVLRALDAKAYNDAFDALEMESGEPGGRLHIPFHHLLLGSLLSFDGKSYKKFHELQRRDWPWQRLAFWK